MTAADNKEDKAPSGVRWFRPGTLRLYSGVVLMVFLSSHLINHTLGLISLNAMEAGREVFISLWRSLPGTIILLSAISVHVILVFIKMLAHRSYRRIPPKEALQIIMGLAIPPLIIGHIVGTRLAHETIGITDSYTYVLFSIWIAEPVQSILQTSALLVAWIHGCLGMHFWLRLKPWYEKAYSTLYTFAIILPILSLCGFLMSANAVEVLAQDPLWRQALIDSLGFTVADFERSVSVVKTGYMVMLGLLGALAISRVVWFFLYRAEKLITVQYPDGQSVLAAPGTTILEASQAGGIPHASVCGGRGRCSTCRIRITEGASMLPPPSDKELAVLRRVGATENTRLACQVPIIADISVIPLLPQKISPRASFARPEYLQGREKEIAILFADLRSFTKFSETKLPYDVVFVINQYFRHMGEAIEKNGGHLDKFIGDGVMALFGLEDDPAVAAKKSLEAAKAMGDALDALNTSLKSDLNEPLRLGIGVHMGQVIIGEMGYGKATSITAIGDAVNTASRLETLNKEYGSQLIFSQHIAAQANFKGQSREEEVLVRGRNTPLHIHILEDGRKLDLNQS
jgi:adenylate cyclase